MSRIAGIGVYIPERILNNDELANEFPTWSAAKIFQKTGIRERRVAAENETASDMGIKAAESLFENEDVTREEIDFLIFCTQAPDYILPTTACVMQSKLGLSKECGAFDMNLGCSGYVYGLSIADALISSGSAKNVLLITSDTYSKYINPKDKSVRTLFGDAAAATLITPSEGRGIMGPFVFGTDGSGYRDLIVETGMYREQRTQESSVVIEDEFGNARSRDDLFMNGSEVLLFSLREVPKSIDEVLKRRGWSIDEVDKFVLHQANSFLINALTKKIGVHKGKVPICVEDVGNTVSSSIPLALKKLSDSGEVSRGDKIVLSGFGVGYSWCSCTLIY